MERESLSSLFEEDNEEKFDYIEFDFEDGWWEWDDIENKLKFNREEKIVKKIKKPSFIEFKDELEFPEMVHFEKNFQRQVEDKESNIVILQDVKDVALYLASVASLNGYFIYVIHTQVYDNFLRAVVIYIHQFMQMSKLMKMRTKQLKAIKTNVGHKIDRELESNLNDMRVIVAKQYYELLKFCLTDRKGVSDAKIQLMENIISMSIQIIWIIFGRKNADIINCEFNRMIRSQEYNISIHISDNKWLTSVSPYESNVLYGTYPMSQLARKIYKKNELPSNIYKMKSPLIQALAMFKGDPRILVINKLSYKEPDKRFNYFEERFCAPEFDFSNLNIKLGILGQSREYFDTMLNINKVHENKVMANFGNVPSKDLQTSLLIPRKDLKNQTYIETSQKYPKSDNETQRVKWLKHILEQK